MGVVFRHTVEAFLTQVISPRRLFTDGELRELGVSPPRDLTIEQWKKFVVATSTRLCPGCTHDQALEEAGREMTRGYQSSLVGRGVFIVAKLQGPRATLHRLQDNYRTADSIMKVTVEDAGERRAVVRFEETHGLGAFLKGLLSEMMVLIDAMVAIERQGDTEFHLRW